MRIFEKLMNDGKLTTAEKGVAAYIAANPEMIASLTLSGVARNTFTSNATVLRLCRKLGYKGYREFQIACAAEQYFRDGGAAGAGDVSPLGTAAEILMERRLASLTATADLCRAAIDAGMLSQAASRVSGAGHFYIFGNGDALLVAIAFANQLSAIGIHPILSQYYNDGPSLISGITRTDTVMIVSFSPESSPSMGWQLERLTEKECNMISIMPWDSLFDAPSLIKIPISIGKDDPFYGFRCRMILDCILCCISDLIKHNENILEKR